MAKRTETIQLNQHDIREAVQKWLQEKYPAGWFDIQFNHIVHHVGETATDVITATATREAK